MRCTPSGNTRRARSRGSLALSLAHNTATHLACTRQARAFPNPPAQLHPVPAPQHVNRLPQLPLPPPLPNSSPLPSNSSPPAGPPDFTAGWWLPLFNVSRQMVLAVLICMVDICESISIAKALARVNK